MTHKGFFEGARFLAVGRPPSTEFLADRAGTIPAQALGMLVRFSCGCVGFVGLGDKALVIESCDSSGPPLDMYWRDLSDKTYEDLPTEEKQKLIEEMGKLLYDGFKFREIRFLLSHPHEVPRKSSSARTNS